MKLKPAGWIAVAVFGVLIVGLLGTAYRSVWGVNRLQPVSDATLATVTAAAEAWEAEQEQAQATATAAAATPTPAPDREAAWETFLQVIYKCDALPDQGDDVALYPESLDALREGIEELTTDEAWLEWCDHSINYAGPEGNEPCWLRRLGEFGPRNLLCSNGICEAGVAVRNDAAIVYSTEEVLMIVRDENLRDQSPYRLIKGQVEYRPEEDVWIVTNIGVTVLPEPPEDF